MLEPSDIRLPRDYHTLRANFYRNAGTPRVPEGAVPLESPTPAGRLLYAELGRGCGPESHPDLQRGRATQARKGRHVQGGRDSGLSERLDVEPMRRRGGSATRNLVAVPGPAALAHHPQRLLNASASVS